MRPRNVGKFKGYWGERQRGWSRISLGVLQFCDATGLGFAWPSWRLFLSSFTKDLTLVSHLIPITCRATSSGREKAFDDSDPKSLKMEQQLSIGAIQRPLCHCWEKLEEEKAAFNRGLAWFEAWPRSSGTIKEGVMAKMDSPLLGEPNVFVLMITRVLCSVQTCLEL